jgi:tRNA 5-methylaminomethyl-2-thiouridine biosynthesis bifunctional protein
MNEEATLSPETWPQIEHADLEWTDQGHPRSRLFNDIYASSDSAIEESRYVFLEKNNLESRWLSWSHENSFTLSELGFGCGLNFLATWALWRSLPASKRPCLNYVAFERYPLLKNDLELALKGYSSLDKIKSQLFDQYPAHIFGGHRLVFEGGKLNLTLFFGDALDCLSQMDFKSHAWFLDGFTPVCNPKLWNKPLIDEIARHSFLDQQTTFSTYTVSGMVRRTLIQAGFEVKKALGFGKKKLMLHGYFNPPSHSTNQSILPNWMLHDSTLTPIVNSVTYSDSQQEEIYDVVVVGAGLAGITTAITLSGRGLKVLIIEREAKATTQASGNAQGVLYTKLSRQKTQENALAISYLAFAPHFYHRYTLKQKDQSLWSATGVLQLGWNQKERVHQKAIIENFSFPESLLTSITKREASHLAGVSLDNDGLYFPQSGWLSPKDFGRFLIKEYNLATLYSSEVTELRKNNTNHLWELNCQSTDKTSIEKRHFTVKAKQVVITNAHQAKSLMQLSFLPLKAIRGQVSHLKSESLPNLKITICGGGYITPPRKGILSFGATFDLHKQANCPSAEDNVTNLQNLNQWIPSIAAHMEEKGESLTGKVGFRCTSPDYQIIVGPVPDYEEMINRFGKLRVDANACHHIKGAYHPGLYVNVAHGSKGIASCPLAAEIIADYITTSPHNLDANGLAAIHPARFIIRDLKRRKI